MKIGIYSNHKLDYQDIIDRINNKIYENKLIRDDDNPDFVFFVGGDGTFLRCFSYYFEKGVKPIYIGVKNGTLSFFSEFTKEDIDYIFNIIKSNNYQTTSHSLLEATLFGEKQRKIYAVNEIRIENPFHTLVNEVYINDELLEKNRGNGLSISTSLGSTAYNKSLGGSIVSPKIETMQLCEIAPIQHTIYRTLGASLVLSKEDVIALIGEYDSSLIGYDHQNFSLENVIKIKVKLSSEKVTFLRSNQYSYIKTLKRSFIN